ncbi:serine hydrolase-domain-containing protein [Podospora australis]|uniref:Serine hydrolase-domain-containing protein n=1 Tax=Podospora australis TaxID=1536484 RepID=A0AAN6WLQ4_9PEZI|nr:serine hydrolase-domain-containing protein [Podospora australis]
MKFLCLPGAYGNAKNFKVQLDPLAGELERRGLAEFVYSQGKHEVDAPKGWEDYFGAKPFYRFLDTTRGDTFETLRRLRHVPHSLNAEDTMRMFQGAGHGEDWHQKAWREALDGVFQTLDEDPEIDALIGYSEGAMVGASLIVEEAARAERSGVPRRIKFAIFISGAPPLKFEGNDRIVAQLFDEAGTVIDIPTFHIFGCDDAFLSSAVALYNVCEQEKAKMYDHGLGHIVPRDAENVGILADIFQDLLPKVDAANRKQAAAAAAHHKNNGGATAGQNGLRKQQLHHNQRLPVRTGSETDEGEATDVDFTSAMARPMC